MLFLDYRDEIVLDFNDFLYELLDDFGDVLFVDVLIGKIIIILSCDIMCGKFFVYSFRYFFRFFCFVIFRR